MYDIPVWYLGALELPVHWVLTAVCCLTSLGLALLLRKKQGFSAAQICLYGAAAAALGFLFARAIYCMVYGYEVFQDEMGEFAGILPFFDPNAGSANVMGFVAGVLLAAPVTAAMTKKKAADYLDMAVVPALVLYILARVIEPLSGQGYGDMMGYEVCVSWIEAALTAIVLCAVPFLRKKSHLPGTMFQYALVLWCLVQILPESLRTDDALFVIIFARVTHLGLAVTLGFTLIRLLVKQGKRIGARAIVLDVIGLAAGLGVAIGTIFALDKTNWPKLLVYALMIASLVELGFVICRRIHKEDVR